MVQMTVDDAMKVNVDFKDPAIPEAARALRPILFREGNAFCCVLGPDPQEGVFGFGNTPATALSDWDDHLKQRLENGLESDDVALYALSQLKEFRKVH